MALDRDRGTVPGRKVDRVRYDILALDRANDRSKVAAPARVHRIDPPRVADPGLGRRIDRAKGIDPAPGRKGRLLRVRMEPAEDRVTGLPARPKAAGPGLDRPGPNTSRARAEGLSTIAARGPWGPDHPPRSDSARPRSRSRLVGRSSGWIPNRPRSPTIGRNPG
jgi:hypothetical protein